MIATPWGNSEDLRGLKLPPGPGSSAEAVADNQRRRLLAAMVASCATKGYEETGVADLAAIAGVSPRSFYQHFEGKHDCFLAALEEVLGLAVERVLEAPAGRDWREEGRNRIAAFASFAAEQPAAARLLLIEAYAAGPRSSELVEGTVRRLEAAIEERLADTGLPGAMPRELVVAAIAATLAGIRARLLSGGTGRLADYAEQLASLLLEFEPPARPLRVAVRPPRRRDEEHEAGDHAERALRAFEALVAERGFAGMTMGQVAARAGMSARTLYANFSATDELMRAAVDSAAMQAVAVMLPAYRRAQSPPEGVRLAFSALYGMLASRPNLAHLLLAGVYEGGPPALERRAAALRAIEPLVSAGVPAHQRPVSIQIASEALLNAVLGLASRRLAEAGAEALPGLVAISSFIVLAPVLGTEPATAAAEGKTYRKSAPPVVDAMLRASTLRLGEHVLVALVTGPKSVAELVEETVLSEEEIVAQVQSLESNGLIEPSPPGDEAGEVRYQPGWGRENAELLDSRSRPEREALSAEIGAVIRAEVEEAVAEGTFDARDDRYLARVPVWLDEQGWEELLHNLEGTLERLFEIQRGASGRLRRMGDPDGGTFGRVLLVSFEVPQRDGA